MASGSPEGAVDVLERQIQQRPDMEVVKALISLYFESGKIERVDRLAASLLRRAEPERLSLGHFVAARAALMKSDLQATELHYQESLRVGFPSRDIALEYLVFLAIEGQEQRLVSTAFWICQESRLSRGGSEVLCAARLLTEIGEGAEAEAVLAGDHDGRQLDKKTLQGLAAAARATGDYANAQRYLQLVVEMDPRDEAAWGRLAGLLETAGQIDTLEEMLSEVRRRFSRPSSSILRAVGRARMEAGKADTAVEILQEARAELPPGASAAWIDAELREAYQALGQSLPTQAPAVARRQTPAETPTAPVAQNIRDANDAPRAPDAQETLAQAEALQSGSGGRYDKKEALRLFRQAAATGHSQASFRLALLLQLSPSKNSAEQAELQDLYERSSVAVMALAQKGDGYAQYLVGTAALIGLGQPGSDREARRWLEPAARQGQSWALHNLAWMAGQGHGLPEPDMKAALEGYRTASALGNTLSMIDLARGLLTPYAPGPDCQEGLRNLERSAQAGNTRAAADLGKVLYSGRRNCVPPDPIAALPWLESAAEAGESGADYDLGFALLMGNGGRKDLSRAVSLLERSAAKPSVLAKEVLALLYATGQAVEKDPATSRKYLAEATRFGSDGFPNLLREASDFPPVEAFFKKSLERLEALASQRDPFAAALLAPFYSDGRGVPADRQRAFELIQIASEGGAPEGLRLLSHSFRNGIGVEKDAAKASRLWRRCAEAGNSFCMMHYSQTLMDSEFAEPDPEAGLRWLIRSAEAGNWWSVKDLGNLYVEGRHGLPVDPDQAAPWKRILADQGDAEARGWLQYNGY